MNVNKSAPDVYRTGVYRTDVHTLIEQPVDKFDKIITLLTKNADHELGRETLKLALNKIMQVLSNPIQLSKQNMFDAKNGNTNVSNDNPNNETTKYSPS
jgi:hypothetical protein